MEKKKVFIRSYAVSFKFQVLSDYYSSGESIGFISNKYSISKATVFRWNNEFETSSKSLSLSDELLNKLSDMRTKRQEIESEVLESKEALQAEIARLRKALEYSELRNDALQEVLKIGREEYGLDLLKKAGAKQ